jgi:hypothetical protein
VAALRTLEHALRRTERWNDLDALLRKQIECFATLEAKLGSVFELSPWRNTATRKFPTDNRRASNSWPSSPPTTSYHELLLKKCGLKLRGQTPSEVVAGSLGALAAATPDPLAAAALHLAAALLIEHRDEAGFRRRRRPCSPTPWPWKAGQIA